MKNIPMKTTIVLLATLSLVTLGGCTHVAGSLRTKNLSIGVNSSSGGGSGRAPAKAKAHCPPGQAKKGNC